MSNPISFFTVSQIQQFIDEGRIFIKPELFKVGQISDGYHTFDELYEHRIALFRIAGRYAKSIVREFGDLHDDDNPTWKSKQHSDGSSYKGWFIAGIFSEPGKQITYHIPISKWDEFDEYNWPEIDKAPEWDGHTSADVLKRLAEL